MVGLGRLQDRLMVFWWVNSLNLTHKFLWKSWWKVLWWHLIFERRASSTMGLRGWWLGFVRIFAMRFSVSIGR